MTTSEFFTRLNYLAWHTRSVANTGKRQIEIFINGLRLIIAKDALIGENPPKSYTEELGDP